MESPWWLIKTLMQIWRTKGRRSPQNALAGVQTGFVSGHAEVVHEAVGVHCRHFRGDLCSVTLTVTAFRPCAGTTS